MLIWVFTVSSLYAGISFGSDNEVDLTEKMKESLVFLDVTSRVYNQLQPWRQGDVKQKFGYGCAVGPTEVLTTAKNVTDAAFIKVRRYGQNEFVGAKVKVIDYESNLCLLELDRDGISKTLKAVDFVEDYEKGALLKSYWLSSGGHLTTGRGYLDRAEVNKSTTSYAQFLEFVVSNTSAGAGSGHLYCRGKNPLGIAAWFSESAQEAGIIPAERIKQFLADVRDGGYEGFGTAGFATVSLLDPTVRGHLKMSKNLKHGVYVKKVYTLGTGKDALRAGDVILAIDGHSLNPYGRYLHDRFDRIRYHHLVTRHVIGETVKFEVWREGKRERLKVKAEGFSGEEMLVPYYEHGKGPEYVVTGGFVFQKLTRDYLATWGDDWSGKVPAHLYNYWRYEAFSPTEERRDIVILSYVLPAEINRGYQQLRGIVVKSINGKEIQHIADVRDTQGKGSEAGFDVVEFEMDWPKVVIDRKNLGAMDAMIGQLYGVRELFNYNR